MFSLLLRNKNLCSGQVPDFYNDPLTLLEETYYALIQERAPVTLCDLIWLSFE